MALIDHNGRCRIEPAHRSMMPHVLAGMVSIDEPGACASTVWEDGESAPLAAFAIGVFVHDWFFDGLLAQPGPFYSNAFYASIAAGRSPMLTQPELAQVNARGDLNLLALHYVQRMHPANAELLQLGFVAFATTRQTDGRRGHCKSGAAQAPSARCKPPSIRSRNHD